MRNILLTIEYDGTNFCGWQRQTELRTVQGEIEKALEVILKRPVQIEGTSRTDSGVHALGQQASLIIEDGGIPTENIPRAVNDILAFDKLEGVSDIRIKAAKEMPAAFHARYDSKGKRYIYKIYNAAEKSPLRRTHFYQISSRLNLEAMKEAAKYIVGTHDFKSFETSSNNVRETTVRTIYKLEINRDKTDPDMITVSVEGDGFLYNMVRIIVGTLVEVGQGKLSPGDLPDIIESKNRSNAGHTAPPQGLYLDEVFY